jgi:hypothetical protein
MRRTFTLLELLTAMAILNPEASAVNPLSEFIRWLAFQAARGTYWLLLLALLAFELARRRGQRKRKNANALLSFTPWV